MHETEDVVGRLTDHRIAGMRSIERILDGLTGWGVPSQEVHLGAGHHHLAEAPGSSIETSSTICRSSSPRVLDPRTIARISSSVISSRVSATACPRQPSATSIPTPGLRNGGRPGSANYTMLLHLPHGYTPELVRDALAARITTLPEILRASLTWDHVTSRWVSGQQPGAAHRWRCHR